MCCRFHAIAPVRHSFEKAFEFIKGPLDRWLRKISFATLETLRLEVGDAVPIELEQNAIKFFDPALDLCQVKEQFIVSQ